MSLQQDFPELSTQIASAMEQLGGLSAQTLNCIEQAAQLVANSFVQGGKLLVLASAGAEFLGDSLRADLMRRYTEQQPALPCLSISPQALDAGNPLLEVEALGCEGDTLLLIGEAGPIVVGESLRQLYDNRGIVSLYLGPGAQAISTSCALTIDVHRAPQPRQLEISLFILHCLSARIQSLVFTGS